MQNLMIQMILMAERIRALAPFAAVLVLIMVVGWWGIFRKAGYRPWLSVISPINLGVLHRIAWRQLWEFPVFIVCAVGGGLLLYTFGLASRSPDIQARMVCMGIGAVLLAAALVLDLITHVRLARRFGKSGAFALGLVLLRPVFTVLLGFDGSRLGK